MGSKPVAEKKGQSERLFFWLSKLRHANWIESVPCDDDALLYTLLRRFYTPLPRSYKLAGELHVLLLHVRLRKGN